MALFLLVLLPGAYALAGSRRLFRRIDGPLLPDLVAAHFRNVGTVAGISLALGVLWLSADVLAAASCAETCDRMTVSLYTLYR
jgi:hypothetical protein